MENSNTEYRPIIMIIDDIEENIHFLVDYLEPNGFRIEYSLNAQEALHKLKTITPDMILLDYSMPEIDGISFLKIIKADAKFKEIPVIFVTARKDEEAIVNGFEAGAIDFVTKPFNSKELLARIHNHLELKFSKQIINLKIKEITEINKQLEASKEEIERYYRMLQNEIMSASDYVYSLLPQKLNTKKVTTDWLFKPSQNLGGDSFGYHWIDKNNFAVYLLDVAGHGVASALESVSVLNMLRFSTLPSVDFTNPGEVFNKLNKAFPIQYHNFLFFTIFYAVFNTKTRELRYAGAGHPPAFVFSNGDSISLESDNIIIGTREEVNYSYKTIELPNEFDLVIYSDGVIDPNTFDINQWDENFLKTFVQNNLDSPDLLQKIIDHLDSIKLSNNFKDDISILKVSIK